MTDNKSKESFIMYTEQIELFQELTNEQAGELIKGIFKYVQTNEQPKFSGISKMAFITIRQMLDRNAEKYEEKRERMSQNGKKGGRPKLDSAESDEQNTPKEKASGERNSFLSIFKQTGKPKLFKDQKEEPPVDFTEIIKKSQPKFYEQFIKYKQNKIKENPK